MRLTSITITDLAGFSGTINFPLHAVSLVQGNHGTGKSSLLDILAYSFGRRPLAETGGRGIEHDATMIHGNAERGEAVIKFDDDTSYRVTVSADTTTRQVRIPGSKKWDRATPQFIDSLVNALSYDPFSLKTLTEKQRVEALLMASPITVTAEEIAVAVGDTVPISNVRPDLDAINQLHEHIYEKRRSLNVAADTQRKHAQQLREALPPESHEDVDWQAQAKSKRKEQDAINQQLQDHRKTVGDTFRAYETERKQFHADHVEELRAAFDKAVQNHLQLITAEIESARAEANSAVREKQDELHPQRDILTAEIATAEERAMATAQVTGTRKAVDAADKEAEGYKQSSDAMTAALERLVSLKESVAGRLAIKGITIASPKKDQPVDICREEKGSLVPFSRWNEADKDVFCLRMAVLLHGTCGVVFVDEIGHLTDERKAMLMTTAKKYATEQGMQWIFSEAVEGPLTVKGIE